MQIEKNLEAIRRLLASIHNPTIPDVPPAFVLCSAAPCLQMSHREILEGLAFLLQSECGDNLGLRFAATLTTYPTHYWERTPISQGVIDTAAELHIIDADEKATLLKAAESESLLNECSGRVYRDFDITLLIDQLQSEIACVRNILSRIDKPRVIVQQPVLAVAKVQMPQFEPPNLDLDDRSVRAALEARFKGSFEREIEGTLGKILIFRNPPNTSPERIAVKTIDPDRIKPTASLGAIERFTHEVRHWIKYRHYPLILYPFFTAFVKGWPFVAMPYCEWTLRDYIDRRVQRHSHAEAVALMIEAISALEYAARYGLSAHQDLKPENILLQEVSKKVALDKDYPFIWRARLADFGLANAYKELKVRYGSRPYLAPEQYEQEIDLSKVDVFACGVMLHELLTGVHPIGVVTSDVWPKPKDGQSPQWQRENKWKHWARSTEKICPESVGQLGDFRHVIEESLRTNPTERLSLTELQRELLDILKRFDMHENSRQFIRDDGRSVVERGASYEALIRLLLQYHFQSVWSEAISDDAGDDRYQLDYLKALTHSVSE